MKKSMLLVIFFVGILGIISAASDPSYCCERTTEGAWCVNENQTSCDSSYNSAPTSCETTSYCRLGTCYDSVEGLCMENVPQRTCTDNGGTWSNEEIEAVPQCQLGCCIIADQAAFVSLVRCKRLSTLFGVENDYRTDITNEISCIAEANSKDVGACVYEEDFERICDFTTRGECDAGNVVDVIDQANVSTSSERTFYQDFLCSAEELATSCARQTGTTCYNGDVYWTDSCGNRENVWSGDEDLSWNNGRVMEAGEVCNPSDGTNSNCGNCDYLLGTRCEEYEGIGNDGHYCQRTECTDREGNERLNGESWCVHDDYANSVGSRYFREICRDGEVVVEPCADYRNEICYEGSVETDEGEYGTAACRVNRWQDCVLQTEYEDCVDDADRDCKWLPSVNGMNIDGGAYTSTSTSSTSSSKSSGDAFTNPTASVIAPITGNAVVTYNDGTSVSVDEDSGICVPLYSPGLEFWEDGSASEICGQASARCVIVIEEGLLGGEDVVSGEECLNGEWAEAANLVCTSLGDCGGDVNYDGEYSADGYKWINDGEEMEL